MEKEIVNIINPNIINFKNPDADNKDDNDDLKSVIHNNWKQFPENFLDDDLKYQNWFDACASLEECRIAGYSDFFGRILTPELLPLLGSRFDNKAVEIGYGGGRLTSAACKVFDKVTGIDILSAQCSQKTSDFIKRGGSNNFELIDLDNAEKIEDESIDFVYSFIVFQHFSSKEQYYSYVNLIKRILRKNGIGRIFFGLNKANKENITFVKSFNEGTAYSSILYNPRFVFNHFNEEGLKIISAGQTAKSVWDDPDDPSCHLSNQFFITFQKE